MLPLDATPTSATPFEALGRARELAGRNAEAALAWYERAAEAEWGEPAAGDSSIIAAYELAMFAHGHGNPALCELWCRRLTVREANDGWRDRRRIDRDRRHIDEEADTPRHPDGMLASRNQSATYRAMTHLLDEHEPTLGDRLKLIALLAENQHFGGDGTGDDVNIVGAREAQRVARVLALAPRTPHHLLLSAPPAAPSATSTPLTAADAWALTDWVLRVAVPLVVACSGHVDLAFELPTRIPPDLPRAGLVVRESAEFEDWRVDELPVHGQWDHPASVLADFRELVRKMGPLEDGAPLFETMSSDAIIRVGLVRAARPFADTPELPDYRRHRAATSLRLLGGSAAWCALWLATRDGLGRDWASTTDFVGGLLFDVLTRAIANAEQPNAMRDQLASVLGSAYREFIDERITGG